MSAPRRLHLLACGLALVLAAAPLAGIGPARADGDGTAMFGIPAGQVGPGPVHCDAPDPVAGRGEAGEADAAAEFADAAAAELAAELAALQAAQAALARSQGLLAQVAPAAPAAPTPRVRPVPRAPRAPRDRRAERVRVATDSVIVVRPGTRLELHNFGGAVTIGTWTRNAVHLHAEHHRRDRVEVRQQDGVLHVETASPGGPAPSVDFRLQVPAWLPVSLSGVYNDVTAEGLEGGLVVETVRGDIAVKRASGQIELRSVEGLVDLLEAKGRIKVSSVNDGVRLVRVGGDVAAEAVNGDIQMIDVTSRNIEATTVNGALLYDGKLFDGGNYRFSTHSGDIAFALTDQSNATVSVSTYAGEFAAPFPIRLSRTFPGKQFAFALGNGRAKVDLESFQGAIQLFRPGDRAILERFRESWNESERERSSEAKWILKGLPEEPDDPDDEDAAPARVPSRPKGR